MNNINNIRTSDIRDIRLGFIGAGKMGSAIAKGISASGIVAPENIYIFDVDLEKTALLHKETGICVAPDINSLVEATDIIILAVVPGIIKTALEPCSYLFNTDKVLVSIAAGVPIKVFRDILGENARIFRTMPNRPALIGKGMTLISYDKKNIRRGKIIKKYRWFILLSLIFICTVSFLTGNNLIISASYKEAYKEVVSLNTIIDESYIVNNRLAIALKQLDEENNLLKSRYQNIIDENKIINEQLAELKEQNNTLVAENNALNNENIDLAEKYKTISDDNIALQNSLKLAASVGIKPQNYTAFREISSRSSLERGDYIGQFLGTAYTPSTEECGNNEGITNSGEPVIPGISIAIDKSYWPFGTIFYIKGLGYAIAMDTGNGVKGKYRFDFAVFNKEFAFALGSQKWDVYLIKMGTGVVGNIEL